MPIVEILIGNIASGKSTYSRKKAECDGYLIVNDDSIVQAIHGGNYKLYDQSMKPIYKLLENMVLYQGIALDKNIIVDRGLNVRKRSRARFIHLAKSLDAHVRAVVFEQKDPQYHAKRRHRKDSRGLPLSTWMEVATRMHNNYEPPSFNEGFDEIFFAKLNDEQTEVLIYEIICKPDSL